MQCNKVQYTFLSIGAIGVQLFLATCCVPELERQKEAEHVPAGLICGKLNIIMAALVLSIWNPRTVPAISMMHFCSSCMETEGLKGFVALSLSGVQVCIAEF